MNIDQKLFDQIFRQHRKNILVYLRSSKTKSDNYDKFRETGFDQTNQNPLTVKALTKVVSPGSLTHNELGLVKAGALQIIIQNRDVNLIKNSEKLTIDNIEYYVYDDAVGQKFLIFPTQFANFSKIIIFRKDVG
jgi:hypothetical protein